MVLILYFYFMDLRFPKNEKLKSRKSIETLFSEGKSISKFPIKLIYLEYESQDCHKAAFAIPKKNFKKAISRNRIKRQMREAYRLHKQLLRPHNGKNFALLFLYISKDEPQYRQLETSMRALLNQIADEIHK